MKLQHILIYTFFLFFGLTAKAQIGTVAPDFTATDAHGNEHNLYSLLDSGKYVVLDFFYTTCGPCQFYAPQVNLAYEAFGCNNKDVFFISIDWGDTNAEVLAYEATHNIEYPTISGVEGGGNQIISNYPVPGYPTFYVIEPENKTIAADIDPPTLAFFEFKFNELGVQPQSCETTSITETESTKSARVFPNPVVENQLNVQLPETITGNVQFEILDFSGRRLQFGEQAINGNGLMEIELNQIGQGTFYLKVIPENGKTVFANVFFK